MNDSQGLVEFPDNGMKSFCVIRLNVVVGIFSESQQLKTIMVCIFCVLLQGLNQMRKVAQVGLDGVRRIDWHDYEAMRRDAARSGRSELADAAVLFGHIC